MEIFLVLVFLVILFLVIQKRGNVQFPYVRQKALFSPAERSFLGVLDAAVGSNYRVFGKVRIADIAAVKTGLKPKTRQGALNKIAFKHFDYVVCRSDDLSIVCVVELNDRSHNGPKIKQRDTLVAKVCETIELPLLFVTAKRTYNVEEVRQDFLTAIGANNEPKLTAK